MTDKEKAILERLSEIFPKLTEVDKEMLIVFGTALVCKNKAS